MNSSLVVLKLDEERYAVDSSNACSEAENEAQRTNARAVYPEPFNSVGCGYSPLNDYVRNQCSVVAAELGLDQEYCIQTELMVTLYCGTKADYAKFVTMLGARLQAVKGWVTNAAQLWPETQVADQSIAVLALAATGQKLPLQVLESQRGFYIGAADNEGPVSRESEEYWPSSILAGEALQHGGWTQRTRP